MHVCIFAHVHAPYAVVLVWEVKRQFVEVWSLLPCGFWDQTHELACLFNLEGSKSHVQSMQCSEYANKR